MSVFDNYECDGQLSLFDIQKPTIEEVHKEKPWARACTGRANECSCIPENGICTSLYKCSRRMEYQTLNSYYIQQMNGAKTLMNPIDGCTILCDENKAEADDLILKTKEYFGFEV